MAIPVSRTPGAKAAGTTAPVSVPLPADIAIGDVAILVATTIAGGTVTITANGGGAWTPLTGTPINVVGGEKLYVWWRRHATGDYAPSIQAGSDHICAGVNAYGGCIASGDPVHVIVIGTEAVSDTSFSFATGLTGIADCICLVVASSGADSNTGQYPVCTNANLSNIARRMNYNTNSGGGGGFALEDGGLAVAGAMGTWAGTLTTATPKAYIAFALQPSPAVQYVDLAVSVSGISSVAAALDAAGPTYVDMSAIVELVSSVDANLTAEVGYVDMAATVAAVSEVSGTIEASEPSYVDMAASVESVAGARMALIVNPVDYADMAVTVVAVSVVAGQLTTEDPAVDTTNTTGVLAAVIGGR